MYRYFKFCESGTCDFGAYGSILENKARMRIVIQDRCREACQ